MATPRFRYSRWDGTQVGFDLDADAVLEEITDDLLYHGDLHAALRRLLQQGFRDRQGQDVQGVRDLLDRLRQQREERLDRFDLGGVYDEIADELREVVQTERDEIDRQLREAQQSGDPRRAETAQGSADERNMQLEMLPPDLAGMVRELQSYDFASPQAAAAVRGAGREAAPAGPRQLRQPHDRGRRVHDARGHGPHEGHDGRAQPDARPAVTGRGARLRRVHGALRRLLPREPEGPRRAARGAGPPHGRHAGDARVDDARAAGADRGAGRPAARGHGPALAGRPARQPAARHVPRHGLGPGLRLPGAGPAWAWPRRRRRSRSWATSTASSSCCATPPTPARWPRPTSTGPASCWATTPPAASTSWAASPACCRRPG